MADIENVADPKIIADGKIMAEMKIIADDEIPAAGEKQADGKILAVVEISASGAIPVAMEKPAELEKQAACLLFRLGGISNCWLLPGPPDEHVLLIVDVMNLACSLQVSNGLLVPSFYGQTLSRTVPAVCTGLPCQEMAQIHAATRSLASAWNSTDFCQITETSNFAYKCPITEPKKPT